MAYLQQDDPDLIEDLLTRKEFYWIKRWKNEKSPTSDIIPRFMLDDEIARSGYLKLIGHQQFVENYFNPNTSYRRLHIKWSTGSGKTLGGLAIAMNFIKNYSIERDLGNVEIGSVFIIGFSERAFKNELLRYPEFGFLSKEERIKLDKLKRLASVGSRLDLDKYHDMTTRIKKRFSNRKGNGFFRFFGYKAFVNRIFVTGPGVNINDLSEEQIRVALSNGKITYNETLLNEFKNSLIICDEIHNVYNSAEKNNWGIAIQAVLDREESVRCITLSATPLNNSPAEIVDLLNLLLPAESRVSRNDFFINDKDLKPGALEKIAELSKGRFSFLIDVNPKYYPKVINEGESLKEIPYLKFIRCVMSPFHYKTYKTVYTGTLSQESQYLVDFALPNPEDPNGIGIFQTSQIKKLIPNATQKWKDKYGLDYNDGKLTGDLLIRENLSTYSNKYARMIDEIMSDIKQSHGKIFIYHNVVHMSGVLFIEQVLIKNGFLDEFSTPSDNTICMQCGKRKYEHAKEGVTDGGAEEIKDVSYSDTDTTIEVMEFGYIGTDRTAIDKSSNVSGGSDNISLPDTPDNHRKPSYSIRKEYIDSPHSTKITGGSVGDNAASSVISTKLHKLIKVSKNEYSWDTPDSHHILTLYNKKKYYWIPTVHKFLLTGDKNLLNSFKQMIEAFTNKDLMIRIRNDLGKPFGDWLLANGFVLKTHEGTYSYLIKPADINSGLRLTRAIGGANSKSHLKHKTTHLKHELDSTNSKSHLKHKTTHLKHKFSPARFIMAHSDIDKAQMEHSLERFNGPDNVTGNQFLILVGSKILKESYDIKAIQNEYIMYKPDNIPTFIQIRGRAVRKGSHKGLPPEQHVVRMKLFTSCLPTKQETGLDKGAYKLSYEEEKYKEKVASFQVIQKIEKVLHENSIDAVINHEKVQLNMTEDPLGPLPYNPVGADKFSKEMDISKLHTATFDVYHAKKEIDLIKIIIKRLFIELSSIWEYKDLLEAVKNPPVNYETEINTKLFTENNFLIALNQLLWDHDPSYTEPFIYRGVPVEGGVELTRTYDTSVLPYYMDPINMTMGGMDGYGSESPTTYKGGWDPEDLRSWILPDDTLPADYEGGSLGVTAHHTPRKSGGSYTKKQIVKNINTSGSKPIVTNRIIDHLYDTSDKIVALPGGQDSVIVPIPDGKQQYYVLFPINRLTNVPNIDIELPYRIIRQEEQKTINMNTFIQTKRIDFDYDDKKKIFYRKYSDISIENMENVVCEYGTTFHIKFAEECIEYVFKAWTDPVLERNEMHEFYFKMLYYYDLMSLIMWAYTSKPRVFKDYVKYAIPIRAKDIKLKALARYEKRREELDDISPDDTSDLATSGVINLLKSTFNRTSNTWIPAEFRQQYDETVNKSISLFEGRRKRSKTITKVSADLLPIGHYISKFPKLYIPDKGWDENPTYLQNEQEFKENNLLVGFDERSNTGVHIRFKIRNPIHNIKKYKDSRQTEKGTVCKSKSKEYLREAAKKLDITIPDKVNVEDLCVAIRSKLIRLELKERIKKSNVKYFYFFYEQRPETRTM